MTAAEFSHVVTLAEAGQGRSIRIEADADARAAIAQRLGLVALDRFVVSAEVRAVAGGIAVNPTVAPSGDGAVHRVYRSSASAQ